MAVFSSSDRGPNLNVGSWLCTIFMVFAVCVKIYTKWVSASRLSTDDYFVLVAMVCNKARSAKGHCVAVSKQVQAGLGRSQTDLTLAQVNGFFIATYITQLFYILTVYTAKLAGFEFLLCLAPPKTKRSVVRSFIALSLLWAFVGSLIVAFQCELPHVWLPGPGKCIDQRAFWVFNVLVDVFTQLAVGCMPFYLLFNLQMRGSRKLFPMISFTSNLATIPLTILRVVYLFEVLPASADTTRDSFKIMLVGSINVNVAVIAACVPFFRPIMNGMAPGMITNELQLAPRLSERNRRNRSHPWSNIGILRTEMRGASSSKSKAGNNITQCDSTSGLRKGDNPKRHETWELQATDDGN